MATKKKREPQPPTNWLAIKQEYIAGGQIRDLAAKYGIAGKTISEKASREKWLVARANVDSFVIRTIEERVAALALKYLEGAEKSIDGFLAGGAFDKRDCIIIGKGFDRFAPKLPAQVQTVETKFVIGLDEDRI